MAFPVLVLVLLLVGLVLAAVAFRNRRRGDLTASRGPAPTPAESPRVALAEPATKARDGLGAKLRGLLGGGPASEDAWAKLEDLLVRSDVGPAAAQRLVERVRERYEPGADLDTILVEEITSILDGDPRLHMPGDRLGVMMVVGVNGSGKTTTIGKLAGRLGSDGKQVTLAGSDTFRAAASEQLQIWAERAGAHIVTQARGADPGSVAFDAVRAAQARGAQVLIVDTAGRLHTRTPLMDELRKVKRVLEKAAGQVDETLLVLDATTGQNGIAQARAFTEAVGVTGVALAKLDGTAKGGIVLAVREELGVPVKLVGTGEGPGDIEAFDASSFAERLVRG